MGGLEAVCLPSKVSDLSFEIASKQPVGGDVHMFEPVDEFVLTYARPGPIRNLFPFPVTRGHLEKGGELGTRRSPFGSGRRPTSRSLELSERVDHDNAWGPHEAEGRHVHNLVTRRRGLQCPFHSVRRVVAGSTRAARHAGTPQASNATAASTAVTPR